MAQPKFAQIKQYIISKIKSGEWAENSRVASENELGDLITKATAPAVAFRCTPASESACKLFMPR